MAKAKLLLVFLPSKFIECLQIEERYEIFAVANIVGGTIVIPHTRRAAEFWEALLKG